jgi:hypothetical protein
MPMLVLLSYVIGPAPMILQFWPGAVVMVLISHYDSIPGDRQRARGGVCRGACTDGISDFRHDALPVAAPNSVKGVVTATTTPARHVFRGRTLANVSE